MTEIEPSHPPASSMLDRYLPREFAQPAEAAAVDFTAIRAILWRQRYIILGVIGLALLAGTVLTMLTTPRYDATATVRINIAGGSIIEGQDIEPFVATNEYARYAQTLSDVVESRSMAFKVVDHLDLQNNTVLFGDAVTDAGQDDAAATRREIAAGMLMGGVRAEAPFETRILSITFNSTDPVLAAGIVNGYTDMFLAENVSEGLEANSYALDYLQEQIATTRTRLQDAELRANEYARSNRLVDQQPASPSEAGDGGGASVSLSAANLAAVNSQFVSARAARMEAEQRWRAVANVPAEQLPKVQQNATIQRLRTELTSAQDRLRELRVRYLDGHPQVVEVLQRIDALERDINVEGSQIKSGIRREYEIAQARESALSREVSMVTDETLDEQDRRVPYNLIDREVSALRDQLAALLGRYNELSSASNLRSNNVTLLDRAIVPGAPSSPNMLRNLIAALALGIGAAAGLALLREVFDNRLRSVEDVKRRFGVNVLGQTPIADNDALSAIEDPFDPVSEAYASIRATLDFVLRDLPHPVVQVTSTIAGEGKTTTALALAQNCSAQGKRVLLIDMDLRRPSIARAMQTRFGASDLLDVLYGRAPIEQAVLRGENDNLQVLGVSRPAANPVEILSSGLLHEFIQRIRYQFDIVIIDSSPVMGIADAPLMSRFVDGVVFVIEANRTNVGQTKAALRRLQDVGASIIGAVLTKFRPLEAGENYNYQHRYYRYEPVHALPDRTSGSDDWQE